MSTELKARAWDLQEALRERQEFEQNFFGALGDLLEIPQDVRTDPQVYLNAVVALKEKTKLTSGEVGEIVQ